MNKKYKDNPCSYPCSYRTTLDYNQICDLYDEIEIDPQEILNSIR